ncbi:MAG: DUF3500 domain-containing protein [Gammaproteobacteria bacterium]|nr:DUF3500 domain-containing protein [Gammaproteobacteria bacterium]
MSKLLLPGLLPGRAAADQRRRGFLRSLAGLAGALLAPLPIRLQGAGHADAMARAARAFLATLDDRLRERSRFPFGDRERFDWHYIPRGREGVALREMSAAQRRAAESLLASALSPTGLQKVQDTMALEAVLKEIELFGLNRDPDNYAVAIFGEPGAYPWGWRFEGHHLSLNFTLVTAAEVAVTPSFIGSNPATVPSGPRKGLRTMGLEQDLGLELVTTFDGTRRERVVLRDRTFGDILTGPGREDRLREPEGLALADMSDGQRDLAMRLVDVYLGNLRREMAEAFRGRIRAADPGRIHFAWAGGFAAGEPHYYRLHGPAVLIEYDNTQGDATHIHSVLRDPVNDFGRDELARHYATGHHHHASRATHRHGRALPPRGEA